MDDFIFAIIIFVIFIIFITWFIIHKFIVDYFVIEIKTDLTGIDILTIHNSWFFQEDLLFSMRAKTIKICNPEKIEIEGLVEIKKLDSKKFDFYFKFSKNESGHYLINISNHAFCRYVC